MRKFKSALLQRFTGTDEGPVTQYLGCQLNRDRPNRTSQLVQTAYAERLFHTFDMWDEVHTVATPCSQALAWLKLIALTRLALLYSAGIVALSAVSAIWCR